MDDIDEKRMPTATLMNVSGSYTGCQRIPQVKRRGNYGLPPCINLGAIIILLSEAGRLRMRILFRLIKIISAPKR